MHYGILFDDHKNPMKRSLPHRCLYSLKPVYFYLLSLVIPKNWGPGNASQWQHACLPSADEALGSVQHQKEKVGLTVESARNDAYSDHRRTGLVDWACVQLLPMGWIYFNANKIVLPGV